jgi:hypothetical protein
MARLGELIVAAGLLTYEQIESALRVQVVWGARLGTNLVELKLMDLDAVTRALGRQHGLPAALARHFDNSDPELQRQFSPDLAEKYSVVPLVYLGPTRKIALACLDPLGPRTHAAIAAAFGVPPSEIVVSIAAELRLRYHLERVYQIQRGTRFLRSKRASTQPLIPTFDELEIPMDSDVEIPIDIDVEVPIEFSDEELSRPGELPSQASADDLEILIDEAVASVAAPASTEDSDAIGRERRRYVRTLADFPSGKATPPPTPTQARPRERPSQPKIVETKPLGRIAIRRVAVGDTPAQGRPVVDTTGGPAPTSVNDAMRAIRRGPNRDRVADLVIDTIERFDPKCEAALVLIVRGDVAISWRSFSRSGGTSAELAVPLDQPGLVPSVVEANATQRGTGAQLRSIDQLLLDALGTPDADLVVVPVSLGTRVMCVIATAMTKGASPVVVEAAANAAGTAFTRLIHAASR